MRTPRMTPEDLETLTRRGFRWRYIGNTLEIPSEKKTRKRYGSGKRADLDGLFQRSTWEANYTRYLKWCQDRDEILDWKYEPKEFVFPIGRGKGKTYKPDWGVILLDGRLQYREMKGRMLDSDKTKLKRM